MSTKLCFLDLETTGFSAEKDSIIEISFVIYEGDKLVGEFDRVCLPNKSPLNQTVIDITGITQDELDKNGVQFESLREEVTELIGDAVIVGHNIDFDIRFLVENGVPVQDNPRLDTHEIARIVLIGEESYALEVLTTKYGFVHESAHRAMSDVIASKALYDYMITKIDQIPAGFLSLIKPFLEGSTDWYAKHLFENVEGGEERARADFVSEQNKSTRMAVFSDFSQLIKDSWTDTNVFVHQSDVYTTAQRIKELAEESEELSLIITPDVKLFPEYSLVPTPYIILDEDRLHAWAKGRKLSNQETTFYLKLWYRAYLGYRGMDHCDLFFEERGWWSGVCLESVEDERFDAIMESRKDEKVLCLTPNAFAELIDHSIIRDRIMFVSETEVFADKLLFGASEKFGLKPYFNSADEDTVASSSFFLRRIARDFVEPRLTRELGSFPEKILLSQKDQIENLISDLGLFVPSLPEWIKDFEQPQERTGQIRWVEYAHEGQDLVFGSWEKEKWMALQDKIKSRKKVCFFRVDQDKGGAGILRTFVGSYEGVFLDGRGETVEVVFDSGDLSLTAPNYIENFANKIRIKAGSEGWNIVLCGGNEVVKNLYNNFVQEGIEDPFYGERVMGGNGKLLEKIKGEEGRPAYLFINRFQDPFFETMEVDSLVLQKFVFLPPHPILTRLEAVFKQAHMNLWDMWTIPRAVAETKRRMAWFPHAKKIVVADPRANARWAKGFVDGLGG